MISVDSDAELQSSGRSSNLEMKSVAKGKKLPDLALLVVVTNSVLKNSQRELLGLMEQSTNFTAS